MSFTSLERLQFHLLLSTSKELSPQENHTKEFTRIQMLEKKIDFSLNRNSIGYGESCID